MHGTPGTLQPCTRPRLVTLLVVKCIIFSIQFRWLQQSSVKAKQVSSGTCTRRKQGNTRVTLPDTPTAYARVYSALADMKASVQHMEQLGTRCSRLPAIRRRVSSRNCTKPTRRQSRCDSFPMCARVCLDERVHSWHSEDIQLLQLIYQVSLNDRHFPEKLKVISAFEKVNNQTVPTSNLLQA